MPKAVKPSRGRTRRSTRVLASAPSHRKPGRPVGGNSELTRARIVDAARACFTTHGYAGASNRDIAKRADITAAAIYQYFDSKLELYLAAVHESIERLVPRLRTTIAPQPTARAALRAIVQSVTDLERDLGAHTPFLCALPLEMQRNAELAASLLTEPGEFLIVLSSIVQRGVASGEIEPEHEALALQWFLSALIGLSQHRLSLGAEAFAQAAEGLALLLDDRLLTPLPRARTRKVSAKAEPTRNAKRER